MKRVRDLPRATRQQVLHLPLYQIIAELPPAKRQILLQHLDAKSTGALARALKDLLGRRRDQAVIPARLRRGIVRAVHANRPAFKTIVSRGGVNARREALASVGGNPLALLLSTAIPLVLGEILK